jgi:hypothetical protein
MQTTCDIFPADHFLNKNAFPMLEKIEIGKDVNTSLIPENFGILIVQI